METLTISAMSPADVDLALDWAAREGWNPGLGDALPFRAADPEGFLMARLGNEPVAVISAVRYGQDFGFIGLYIVAPDQRGRGYGWATWQAGMAHLAGRTVGLDGVVAQQDNYRKSGFVLHHRNIRYAAPALPLSNDPATASSDIVPLAALPFGQVEDYDQTFFPAGRSAFLALWLSRPGSVALGRLRGKELGGYGVIRPCRSGYKIGPLFAETEEDAEVLLAALVAAVPPPGPFFLDVPACNEAAVRLAERHGMAAVFETARMYTGPAPAMALERTFGITTFELG